MLYSVHAFFCSSMILITEICSRVNIVGRLGSQNGFSCQESHVGFSLSQTPTLSACRMRAHHCFNFWVYTSGSQSTVLGTTAAAPGDFMCVCVCVCDVCDVVSNSSSPHGLYVAHQVPLSMGFSRQEYWSGLPFPPLGDLSGPGMEPACPVFPSGGFFTPEPPGKPQGTS